MRPKTSFRLLCVFSFSVCVFLLFYFTNIYLQSNSYNYTFFQHLDALPQPAISATTATNAIIYKGYWQQTGVTLTWNTLAYLIVIGCKPCNKMIDNIPTSLYRPYNESQFLQQIASLTPKSWDLYIVVPILVKKIPGMKKGAGHHIVVPPLLQELSILNTIVTMPPSLGWVTVLCYAWCTLHSP